MMLLKRKISLSVFVFYLISVLMLFASFQENYFHAAKQSWYERFQFDSESLVFGRLVESSQHGILSYGGLLGRHAGEEKLDLIPFLDMQSRIYLTGENEKMSMIPYFSQIGLQGMFFGVVDKFLTSINVESPYQRLNIMHGICSLFLALVLSYFLLFFISEFGFSTAILVLVTLVFSQWIVAMSRNLYWVLFTMYMPMMATIYFLKKYSNKPKLPCTIVFITIAILLFIRCATGFEFISTIILSCYSPVVYFAIKDSWSMRMIIARSAIIGGASIFGFIVANVVHILQTAYVNQSTILEAISARIDHARTRMYADKGTFDPSEGRWEEATTAPVIKVLKEYWRGSAFDFSYFINTKGIYVIKFGNMIILFAIISLFALLFMSYIRKNQKDNKKLLALVCLTWFSFSAPLSWYVLAKIHSYVHLHINHILWHLPFMVFGTALIGFFFRLLFSEIKRRVSMRGISGI